MPLGKAEGPFPKKERLKKGKDIRLALSAKLRVGVRGAKLFFRKSGLAEKRIAFVTARKFGRAVDRNRAKRLGREAYRALRELIPDGWDIVFLMYPANDTSDDRARQFSLLIEKALPMMRGGE